MEQNIHIKERNKKLCEKTVDALKKRHFEAYFCSDRNEALNKVIELISKEETIAWGGSMSLKEIGLDEYLEKNGYKTINRDKAKSPAEKLKLGKEALLADTFLMSANALSEDGELVNIDGVGNRIAALAYGPEQIIVIAGANKITKTLKDAYNRARNYAAPVNLQRIASLTQRETPCLYTGSCADCKSVDSICSQVITTRLCNPKGRIKVILVNEDLGY